MKHRHILIIFLCLGLSYPAFADISQIQEALVNQDYRLVQILSREILAQPVIKKSVSYEARYYLALSYLHLNDYSTAIEKFKELLNEREAGSIKEKVYLGLFDSYYLEGAYQRAEKIIQNYLQHFPKGSFKSLAHLKLARAQLKQAQWKEARDHLQAVIDEYPDSFEVLLAKQLLQEKQFFGVQVGSFLEQSRAQSVVEELRQKDRYAYIIETQNRSSETFYRVRVGEFARLKEAKQLQRELADLGYPTLIYP